MSTQIWQHKTAGERYAVELDSNGVVVDVCGPLSQSDVEAVCKGYSITSALNAESLEEACADIEFRSNEYRMVWPN